MSTPLCHYCNEEIKRKWKHELKNAKFCNKLCENTFRKEHPEFSPNYQGKKKTAFCKVCGESFDYYPSVRPNAQYCKNECRQSDHGTKVSGSNGGRWIGKDRGKVSTRILAKKYFPRECAICGWDESSVDSHHIIPVKEGGENTLSNIINLCPNHHRLADNYIIDKSSLTKYWHSKYDQLNLSSDILYG